MVIRKTMIKMTENFQNVNHLVLNFYPDGYSIAVKLNEFPVFTSETILETAKISYEETSLLDYIENEELPPLLVEMIDGSPKLSQYRIWHNGCLILEVRDKINIVQDDIKNNSNNDNNNIKSNNNNNISNYNSYPTAKELTIQNYPSSHNHQQHLDAQWRPNVASSNNIDNGINSSGSLSNGCSSSSNSNNSNNNRTTNGSYFILLKPTNLSMLNDVLNLTESNLWSAQDRLQLESRIVLHNSPPLFLEPDATKQPPEQCSWPNNKLSNIHTRHKKKLPHNKLKNIYSNNIDCSKNSTSNNNNNNNNTSNNNNDRNNVYQNTNVSLPPELTLQQFLATTRARRKAYPTGYLARFNRFKKHSNSHMN